jgi:hypothetical protein
MVTGNNLLTWKTVLEQNTQSFVIEHSLNQADYLRAGSIEAANNTSAIIDYSFTDKEPLQNIVSYRLKMIDKHGKFTYLKVVSVRLNHVTTAKLYSNPFL